MVWRSTEHVLSRLKICKFLLCLPEFHHFFRRRLILWFYGAITNLQICWRIFRVLPILRWELFPVLCVKNVQTLCLTTKHLYVLFKFFNSVSFSSSDFTVTTNTCKKIPLNCVKVIKNLQILVRYFRDLSVFRKD